VGLNYEVINGVWMYHQKRISVTLSATFWIATLYPLVSFINYDNSGNGNSKIRNFRVFDKANDVNMQNLLKKVLLGIYDEENGSIVYPSQFKFHF